MEKSTLESNRELTLFRGVLCEENDQLEHDILLTSSNAFHYEDLSGKLPAIMPLAVHKTDTEVGASLRKLTESDKEAAPIIISGMREVRRLRKTFEQDHILEAIATSYREIDHQLEQLQRERFDIEIASVYLELFLLTLEQELTVLRDCDSIENALTEKVNDKLNQQNQLKTEVTL